MRVPVLILALTVALLGCKRPAPASGSAAASASTATEQIGVRFSRKLPPPGTVALVEDNSEMRLELKSTNGGVSTIVDRSIDKRKRTTNKTNDKFVTKVSVEYLDHKAEEEIDGKKQEVPSKIKGKKYVVEWNGSATLVTYADGRKVTNADEKELVLEGEWDIGQQGDLTTFIPDRPLKVGESFAATEPSLRALLGFEKEDKITIEKATFTFSGTRAEGAKTYGLFDAKLAVNTWSKKEDLTLVFEVHGQLSVDLETAWLKDISLDGPVKVKSDKSKNRPERVEGSGLIKASTVMKYE